MHWVKRTSRFLQKMCLHPLLTQAKSVIAVGLRVSGCSLCHPSPQRWLMTFSGGKRTAQSLSVVFPSAVGLTDCNNVSSNKSRRPRCEETAKWSCSECEPNLMISTLESVRRPSDVPGFSERCANYTNGRFLSSSLSILRHCLLHR